jgi:hypothetical protein
MAADVPKEANPNITAAIEDVFMSYLAKKRLRHAAWVQEVRNFMLAN